MAKDNSTGKTKGFYERGQAIFDRIPGMPDDEVKSKQVPTLIDTVLKHEQQIQDLAKHLLELQQYMEFKRREWVGLTDAEFDAINPKLSLFQFHKAIEAKLKEKNGG